MHKPKLAGVKYLLPCHSELKTACFLVTLHQAQIIPQRGSDAEALTHLTFCTYVPSSYSVRAACCLKRGPPNFVCKRLDSTYVRLYRPCGLCWEYLTVSSSRGDRCRRYINERVAVFTQNFTDTEISIPIIFLCHKALFLFQFLQPFKKYKKYSQLVGHTKT